MRRIQTDILVVGGGATGTGILRDLAMRGFKTILVEKRDLTHGTTGRFHGLLHSGGRYVVKDPQAAKDCIQENKILRRIIPECIEDTGGFFVLTPEDDPNYAEKFVLGCHNAAIPVEEIDTSQMLRAEPLLNPNISRCFLVPDAAVDSFAAAHANVASARAYGAQVLTYYEVLQLIEHNGHVAGAICIDLFHDEQVTIHADLTINAAGAWVGKLGATIGLEISILPGKGTMLAVNQRIVNTVINRCKIPADGDILVPAHTVAIIGTTDQQVPDPDHIAIEPWEVQRMLTEGEKLIPGFKSMRMLRAWAGVRPLYQESKTNKSRDITRSFVLLDHEPRDGVTGLLTITGGKWTTYRKMAEVTVDKVCEKLGTQRTCRTDSETLPIDGQKPRFGKSYSPSSTSGYHLLGQRLAKIESERTYGNLICECELVTRADIEQTLESGDVFTLDDLRRDLRLGMGPCQGGFCTLRAAGIFHAYTAHRTPLIEASNVALHDFLQERWKGLMPILWGKQLQQERLNEFIYRNVLHIEGLPGPTTSRLAAQAYQPGNWEQNGQENCQAGQQNNSPSNSSIKSRKDTRRPVHTLVIGAGLAGLTAAWQAASRGKSTQVIASGWGATHWGSGCLDVFGYDPKHGKPVKSPEKFISQLVSNHSQHPYAQLGLDETSHALESFQLLCAGANYPLSGSLAQNWLLPTVLGTIRSTCLAPETMLAGALNDLAPMLLVGFEGYHDFYPQMAAANLRAQNIPAQAVTLRLPMLTEIQRIDSMTLAHFFDKTEFQEQVISALKSKLGTAARIGFPAVLGINNALVIHGALESSLGRRVFEIAGLPPSVPGLRLHNILQDAVRATGGSIFMGITARNAKVDNADVIAIIYETAARDQIQPAQNFILASGGFISGGLQTDYNGYTKETVFGLQVDQLRSRSDNIQPEFLHARGHTIFQSGVHARHNFQSGFKNLYVIGNTLAGDFIHERSLEGVAMVTGFSVGKHLA